MAEGEGIGAAFGAEDGDGENKNEGVIADGVGLAVALVAATFPESLQFDQRALQADPDFFLSHLTRADTYQDMGHDELAVKEALKKYRQALRYAPNWAALTALTAG